MLFCVVKVAVFWPVCTPGVVRVLSVTKRRQVMSRPAAVLFFTLCSVQFNSHVFLSQIGARTVEMPVPYPPPNVGAYTQTPSHQPLTFGRKGTDHLPEVGWSRRAQTTYMRM